MARMFPVHKNMNMTLVDNEYVFEDKRRKNIKLNGGEAKQVSPIVTAYKRAKRYEKLGNTLRNKWKNKTPLERSIHAVKAVNGRKLAKMYKQAMLDNSPLPCVGCKDQESHIYKDVLPKVVWICKSCEKLHKSTCT